MKGKLGLIGFGEAGNAFARAGGWAAAAHVFDIKTQEPINRGAMLAAYAGASVSPAQTLEDALDGAMMILSLVTADQALRVAEAAADVIARDAFYCDMNSVAPQTKQAASRAITAAGGRYIDIAIMAPVEPAHLRVPLLLSGNRTEEASARLRELGFAKMGLVGTEVGRASAIKMIRSVMVKGIEALTAECVLAAEAAGVCDEVLSSLDAGERLQPWSERANYNLDRMLVHGTRRAAEMEEVVKTLEALGTGAIMARGTVTRQREMGGLGLNVPPDGFSLKVDLITQMNNRKADTA